MQSKNPEVVRTKSERIMLLSKCLVCNSKELKFLKEKEARGWLSSLGIITSLRQIPFVSPILF